MLGSAGLNVTTKGILVLLTSWLTRCMAVGLGICLALFIDACI